MWNRTRNGVAIINRDSYGPDWKTLKAEVKARDNFMCRKCGVSVREGPSDCHHIIPITRGGSTTKNNLITLCPKCHESKHRHLVRSGYSANRNRKKPSLR